jgi:hypothetical protein
MTAEGKREGEKGREKKVAKRLIIRINTASSKFTSEKQKR